VSLIWGGGSTAALQTHKCRIFFLELMIAPAYRYKLEEHVEMKK
jgi:hypothetical protein